MCILFALIIIIWHIIQNREIRSHVSNTNFYLLLIFSWFFFHKTKANIWCEQKRIMEEAKSYQTFKLFYSCFIYLKLFSSSFIIDIIIIINIINNSSLVQILSAHLFASKNFASWLSIMIVVDVVLIFTP